MIAAGAAAGALPLEEQPVRLQDLLDAVVLVDRPQPSDDEAALAGSRCRRGRDHAPVRIGADLGQARHPVAAEFPDLEDVVHDHLIEPPRQVALDGVDDGEQRPVARLPEPVVLRLAQVQHRPRAAPRGGQVGGQHGVQVVAVDDVHRLLHERAVDGAVEAQHGPPVAQRPAAHAGRDADPPDAEAVPGFFLGQAALAVPAQEEHVVARRGQDAELVVDAQVPSLGRMEAHPEHGHDPCGSPAEILLTRWGPDPITARRTSPARESERERGNGWGARKRGAILATTVPVN
jgi:hypothetical protein